MSDVVNPYQSPETAAIPERPLVSQGNLTESMLISLKQASPWLRFIGILGFISAGLTALSGGFSFMFVPLMRQVWNEIPGFESFSGVFGALFGGGMAVIFAGSGVLIFFPSLFVFRFGSRIRSYLKTGSDQDLEQAFKNNKALWKFVGIICIVSLAIYPLAIVGGIIAVVVSLA